MERFVHWAIDTGVGEGTTWDMSLPVTFGAGAMLVLDSEGGNEFRTCWLGTIEAVLRGPFKGPFAETSKLLIVKDSQSNSRWDDIAAAPWRIQLLVFDGTEKHLFCTVAAELVATPALEHYSVDLGETRNTFSHEADCS
jgi:hypothetical protein